MGLPFKYQHRVTYADCTVGNHIYYARYLILLENARNEFFRGLGMSLAKLQGEDVIFPVIECRVKYLAAARYDDLLTIEVWPAAVQKVRLNFGYRVTNEAGAAILEAEIFHACTGVNEKPRRIPEGLRVLLEPLVREA